MRLLKLFALTLALALPLVLRADDINFDNLPAGTVVTNQYPQAIFSSDPGEVIFTLAQNLGSSLPNFICTAPVAGSIDCTHSVIVNFTSAVNNLTFVGTGVNNTGVVAEIDVFQNGIFSSTVDMIGVGTINPVPVNLSAFSNVTSIDIHNVTDAAGIGWDDFIFNTGSASVPEPASIFLLGIGLLSLSGFRKRLLAR